MDAKQAKQYIEENPLGSITVLDVRQPAEYEAGHIPGAQLVPLPEIKDRMNEIDRAKPVVVYCAIGGRSRVAAQMMAGENFREVYNLSGGFKAWQDNKAIGPEESGLQIFDGSERVEDVLIVSYSLEMGLREFYLAMIPRVTEPAARELFEKLAEIEIHHQDRIFSEYCKVTGTTPPRTDFEKKIVVSSMEGGLTTDQFLHIYNADLESAADVIGLAMTIEAQALDMYTRASRRAPDARCSSVLRQIALEEQAHLKQLGKLMDRL